MSSCHSFFLKLIHATGKVPTQMLRMCNLCPRCEFFNNGSKNKLKRPHFLLSFEFLHSRSQWQLTQQKWMATSNSFLLVFLLSVWQSEAGWGVEEVAIFNDSKDVVQLIFVLIFFAFEAQRCDGHTILYVHCYRIFKAFMSILQKFQIASQNSQTSVQPGTVKINGCWLKNHDSNLMLAHLYAILFLFNLHANQASSLFAVPF